MKLNNLVETTILLSLLIATLGTGYIFIMTIIFRENTYAGFYTSWQFPMILAIFIDAAYYKHLSKINNLRLSNI